MAEESNLPEIVPAPEDSMIEGNLPEQPATPLPPAPPQPIIVRFPQRRPIVTRSILGVTIFVYVLQVGSSALLGVDWPALLGMKINELIVAGEVWRLFTPMLLHANIISYDGTLLITSILHIGFNMYALNILGPDLEMHFGHLEFLLLYVVGGFAGVVASFAFTAAPSLGASTAIFSLLAAQGIFIYKNREVFGPRAKHALRSILNLALINFMIGLSPGIDNWGHMGGALGGILLTWFGGPRYRLEGISPHYSLEDMREGGDTLRASIGVFAIFFVLAAGLIFLRM